MRERTVESYLVREVKKRKGWAIKLHALTVAGLPDRMVLLPGGQVIFVEVKALGEKPRPIQLSIHRKLRKLGFTVHVVDSREQILKIF